MLVKIFDLSHITSHQHYDIGLEAPTFSPFLLILLAPDIYLLISILSVALVFFTKIKVQNPPMLIIISSDCFIFELNHGEGRPF